MIAVAIAGGFGVQLVAIVLLALGEHSQKGDKLDERGE